MSEFTVGQRVMHSYHGFGASGAYKETTVKAVRRLDVLCEDETRWTHYGREWGSGDRHTARRLRPYDEQTFIKANDKAEHRRCADKLSAFRWHTLTLSQLRAADRFVDSLRAE